jgi:hypothetical protein
MPNQYNTDDLETLLLADATWHNMRAAELLKLKARTTADEVSEGLYILVNILLGIYCARDEQNKSLRWLIRTMHRTY